MFISDKEIEKIGFKSVGKNVQISDKAVFYNSKNISIGDNSRIDDFCILSASTEIIIGRYVHIACYTSIIGKGKVIINDYSGLSGRVSVYSSSDSYNGEYMTNPCLPIEALNTYHKDVNIGKHVVVGAGSIILPGITLEDGAAVGAMSLVNKNVEKSTIVAGVPIIVIKKRLQNIFVIAEKLNI